MAPSNDPAKSTKWHGERGLDAKESRRRLFDSSHRSIARRNAKSRYRTGVLGINAPRQYQITMADRTERARGRRALPWRRVCTVGV